MAYADAFYYKTIYYGTIEDDTELARLLERASEKVDVVTFNRSRLFDKLSEYEKEAIKKAVCCEADALYQYGDSNYNISSFSLGDMSVSMTGIESGGLISKRAQSYLDNTRLVSRIL